MDELTMDAWAAVLVGHQWPGSTALATLCAAAVSRDGVSTAFHGYADVLRSITDSVLVDQQGATADGIRASFRTGENHARGVAERNAVKNAALTRASNCTAELRSALAEIAERGGHTIESIIGGPDPTPVKIARIVQVAQSARTDADTRAALCAQEIYGAIQTVLDGDGGDVSARELAQSHGVDQGSPRRAEQPDSVAQQVRQLLGDR